MESDLQQTKPGAVSAVASLDEPSRRLIYDYVRAHDAPLSREDVAAALGVPRRAAAFHLDRLADCGLLAVSFARRTGRSGPGAGRPAKFYGRSDREVSISLPSRHYDLAGRLLAGALVEAERSGEPPRDVLDRQAHDLGRAAARERGGAATGQPAGEPPFREPGTRDTGVLMAVLADHGYEPQEAHGDIVLRNCPFHALAQQHTELVCAMNLHLLEGVLDGLDPIGLQARLDPGPARCCVRLARDQGAAAT